MSIVCTPQEGSEVTRRIMDAFRTLLAEPSPDSAVHFHGDGLNGEPAACFDDLCRRPALDVR
jgi:hypothetical protein